MNGVRDFAMNIAIYLVIMLLTASSVFADTWTVERDGSGDYTVIQDAVNAAASGDTIRIGPGRFNEGQIYTCPDWSEFVRVMINVPELTLIGSGDNTIIGQEEVWELSQGQHMGVVADDEFGNSVFTMESICFENMGLGFRTDNVNLRVRNCLFRHCWKSIQVFGDAEAQTIEQCRFEDLERDGLHLFVYGSQGLSVHDCVFSLWDHHTWNQRHISFSGVSDVLVEGCEFLEGTSGVIVSLGSTGAIRDSEFDGQSTIGFAAGPGSTIVIDGCSFRNQDTVTRLYSSDTHLTATNCVIEDVQDCSVIVSSVASLSFQDCDLAAGDRGTVWVEECTQTPPMHLDFTNNYWGTDNPDSIQALIHDRNDSDAVCRYVDYEPYLDESTPVETKSMSDLKSLFR